MRPPMTGSALIACAVVLMLSAGCSQINMRPPLEARSAMSAIEANTRGIDGALYAEALVSGYITDETGSRQRFAREDATLIFESPRCLYFSVKHSLLGEVARVGSNDERYWTLVDVPDIKRLIWGSWDALESGSARPSALYVPADQLLDGLMFSPLPQRVRAGPPPSRVRVDGRDELWFYGLDPQGWPYLARRVELNSAGGVRRIVATGVTGTVLMDVRIDRYEPLEGHRGPGAPRLPRHYVFNWPLAGARLEMDLTSVRYRTNDLPFCEFPDRFRGRIERLDLKQLIPASAVRAGTSRIGS